jgi:hypothetical protein
MRPAHRHRRTARHMRRLHQRNHALPCKAIDSTPLSCHAGNYSTISSRESVMRGNVGAVILIVVGALLLARNLNLLDFNFFHLFSTWWPLILIAVGAAMVFTPNGDGKDK